MCYFHCRAQYWCTQLGVLSCDQHTTRTPPTPLMEFPRRAAKIISYTKPVISTCTASPRLAAAWDARNYLGGTSARASLALPTAAIASHLHAAFFCTWQRCGEPGEEAQSSPLSCQEDYTNRVCLQVLCVPVLERGGGDHTGQSRRADQAPALHVSRIPIGSCARTGATVIYRSLQHLTAWQGVRPASHLRGDGVPPPPPPPPPPLRP